MTKISQRIYAHISIILFCYIICYFIYNAFISYPTEGDSLLYHIPLAKFILSGHIFDFSHFHYGINYYFYYFPASSEAILAMLMFLHIPLNLFNVIATIALFFVCKRLAELYKCNTEVAIIFAVCICTLNGIIRWMPTQVIDIWLAVFFILSLNLLLNPKKTVSYYALLGFSLGMLIGSKITGITFAVLLLIFYGKSVIRNLTIFRFLIFLCTFILFGGFWYIRNIVYFYNPLYPEAFWKFPGLDMRLQGSGWKTISVLLKFPHGTFNLLNAFFSEYRLWAFSILFCLGFIIYEVLKKRKIMFDNFHKLLYISALNFVVLLFYFPSGTHPNETVSFLRYSYPTFILSILFIFLICKNRKKLDFLILVAIANMILIPPLPYYPKLVLLYIPLAVIVIYREKITERFFKDKLTK